MKKDYPPFKKEELDFSLIEKKDISEDLSYDETQVNQF